MYLTDYPWTLCLTNKQFRVLRKMLRDEELNDHENEVATKMSETIDAVYLKKMDAKQSRQDQRQQRYEESPRTD